MPLPIMTIPSTATTRESTSTGHPGSPSGVMPPILHAGQFDRFGQGRERGLAGVQSVPHRTVDVEPGRREQHPGGVTGLARALAGDDDTVG